LISLGDIFVFAALKLSVLCYMNNQEGFI